VDLSALDLSPPVRRWFEHRFAQATEPQLRGWPSIAQGRDTLIAAPTGSGKTLAAFLVILDRLVRKGIRGTLEDRLEAIYVSPLRALSHDIQRNLEEPLAEIREVAREMGYALPEIRAAVRTGDTPPSRRQAMLRNPPHILVTTPESLYLMLTAEKSRPVLATAGTVIVDEIHALARDRRGSHLALSLARLDALAGRHLARIGLSATQKPVDLIARFLVGARRVDSDGRPVCEIVDLGHQRDLDLEVVVPSDEDLHAVAPGEQWDDMLASLAGLIEEHETTLVFTNTRRLSERLAHRLGERLGAEHVAAHHGSLSRERRLRVETRLKEGGLRALVATASLELGIDIGSVDLVCQIGSPRGIATLLQRVGRSGHALGLVPKGRLYPMSRDELVECAAIVRAVRMGRLDRIALPDAPIDVVAQQIVAACACEDWDEGELLELIRGATGFETLSDERYEAIVEMLARGLETPKGRRAAYLHRDRLQKRLRGRRGARIAALTSGGAIPETGDYRVVLDPDETLVGTVNEDWAIESMAGDVFVLGTHSWQIRRVESGVVRVVDAHGAPPTIPFWLGEAPARTSELSEEVSRLRADTAAKLEDGLEAATGFVAEECALALVGARQIARYVQAQVESVGCVPTTDTLLGERFFDEAGGMQLVVHSPYGARINRGLGMSLRKRFCRSFNMELQAAATDDAIVLSLGSPQTFPLDSLPGFLSSNTIEDVLTQALLGSPLFTTRWRWNASRSLAVLRFRGGRKVPFALQRMQSDDLLAAAFPEQAACQEHVTFPIDVPDQPLVEQTVHDCLHEACDIDGLKSLLERIESGEVAFRTVDTVEPSPFSHEILNAKPYAFLDDAPLEERRTRAVALRHVLPDRADDLARLDPAAIERVRGEAEPNVRDADELYDLLLDLVVLDPDEPCAHGEHVRELVENGRASFAATLDGRRLFAAERLGTVRALYDAAPIEPELRLPDHVAVEEDEPESAVDAAARGHLALLGPVTAAGLALRLGVPEARVEGALVRLESRGVALSGRFETGDDEFCDRALLARIHRYTLARLRREIEPVSARDFLRFLLRWQHLEEPSMGEGGLLEVIEQLSGFEAPAAAWEPGLLVPRVEGYQVEQLDRLCLGGSVGWGRLGARASEGGAQPTRVTPISLFARAELDALLHASQTDASPELRGPGARVRELLLARGALFERELGEGTGLLPIQVEDGLKELVAKGIVTCDGFAPLRRLLGARERTPLRRRPLRRPLARRVTGMPGPDGRWSLLQPRGAAPDPDERAEATAERLLRRYGVVFRDLLAREWIPEGWREVHRALRRMEARGVVRGGRFVSGFTGEQFALAAAIPLLRKARGESQGGREIRVSACDPLNLAGILTPGHRLPAGRSRWLVFDDGLPVAAIERGRRSELGHQNRQVTLP
jgi:ATP-dependent Lhr-like helicase